MKQTNFEDLIPGRYYIAKHKNSSDCTIKICGDMLCCLEWKSEWDPVCKVSEIDQTKYQFFDTGKSDPHWASSFACIVFWGSILFTALLLTYQDSQKQDAQYSRKMKTIPDGWKLVLDVPDRFQLLIRREGSVCLSLKRKYLRGFEDEYGVVPCLGVVE
jgi:hypothetical protein